VIRYDKNGKYIELAPDIISFQLVNAEDEGDTGNDESNFGFDTENIPNMTKEKLLDKIPKDWSVTENNGFIHVRDAEGKC